jgi:hypothetical protein
MGKIKAPSSRCLRWTFQVVLHSEDRKDAWGDDEKYEVLECPFSFARRLLMFDCDEDKQIEEVSYFPAPVSRGMPAWVMKLPADLEELVLEIYQVVWSGQHRLAYGWDTDIPVGLLRRVWAAKTLPTGLKWRRYQL